MRRMYEALGGMRDAAVDYVGACGGVELWRVDVAEAIPRPALLAEGLRWKPTEDIQRRKYWRAHFDALRLFGVLPRGDMDRGRTGIASLSALTTSSPSNSLLPDLLTAQQQDPFLQQVAMGVTDSDDGMWRDFFRNKEGFLCYQEKVMQFRVFACLRHRVMLYFTQLMGKPWRGIRE